MTITRKARGTEIPHRAQRVFFCCDSQNVDKRDSLIADLLSRDAGMDCVVSYLETEDDIDTEALRNELQEHQAVALWVTAQLLDSMTDGKIPVEYSLAKELGVPILPIAEYGELFPRFTELAGAIHGIERSDDEYRVKLKAQLESFLVSEEIIKAIQEKAFTATVFLSYRKMDIQEARGFMKALHDMEGYETVSVWYDNFLTAGRIFSEEIEDSIRKSDAFVLLVTPNLLAKNASGENNYVVSTEYPFARQENKPVLPVEALPTDPNRFGELFPGTASAVSMNDQAVLSATLRGKLGKSAYPEHMDGERSYLLGNAYLKGFGLERDFDRGMGLLEFASEGSGLSALRATEQLAGIHEDGIGTGVDYAKALQWRKRAVVLCEQLYGKEYSGAAATYNNIALIYSRQGDYPLALEWHHKALAISEKALGKEHPDTATTYNNIGLVYYRQGDYPQALEWYQKDLAISEKALGEEHPGTAATYSSIALVYDSQGNYPLALEWNHKALAIYEKALGREHPDTAATYSNIAGVYDSQGDYPLALEWYHKALAVHEKVFKTEHPDTATTYNNIGLVYYRQGDYPRALEWYHKALAIYEKVLGKEHPDTATTYDNIAVVYNRQGDYPRALEWHHKALAIREKALGKEHPGTAATYSNIARAYSNQGDYLRALEWHHKALAIREKALGKEHPDTA
jgi:tetratricopeptide (TPR) repeat protein